MSRYKYISEEFSKSTSSKENRNKEIQKYLNRLKTYDEKEKFLKLVAKS